MKKRITVVYDGTFGLGPRFYTVEAEIGKSMIHYDPPHGHKHRLSTQLFAVATPELIQEAKEINQMLNDLNRRASVFRQKLKEAECSAR